MLGVARAGEVIIAVPHGVLARMEQAVTDGAPLEQAGVLFGVAYEAGDRFYVEIVDAMPFPVMVPEERRVRVSRNAWPQVLKARASRGGQVRVVGWYHSHTGSGAVFSEADRFVHRHFFPAEWQVACVLDTVRHETQFFQGQGRSVEPVGGFHLIPDRPPTASRGVPRVPAGSSTTSGSRPPPPPAASPRTPPPLLPPSTLSGGSVAGERSRDRGDSPNGRGMRSGERRPAPPLEVGARRDSGLARGQGGEDDMAGTPFESGADGRSGARESGENFLRERFVERSLEKIVRLLKEPPMHVRDYVILALLVVITLLVLFPRSRGMTPAQFDELKGRLERMQQQLYALEGTRSEPTRSRRPAPAASPKRVGAVMPSPAPDTPSPEAEAPQQSPRPVSSSVPGESPSPSSSERVHVVKAGETLWGVCKDEYKDGSLQGALMLYNKVADPSEIQVGQNLQLPSKDILEKLRAAAPVAGQKAGKPGRKATSAPPPTPTQ